MCASHRACPCRWILTSQKTTDRAAVLYLQRSQMMTTASQTIQEGMEKTLSACQRLPFHFLCYGNAFTGTAAQTPSSPCCIAELSSRCGRTPVCSRCVQLRAGNSSMQCMLKQAQNNRICTEHSCGFWQQLGPSLWSWHGDVVLNQDTVLSIA